MSERCQICGGEMPEGGSLLRRRYGKPRILFLCDECHDLIEAVAHDGAYEVFNSLTTVTGNPERTYQRKLEPWEERK